jgi:hypothetical protein
MQLWNQIVALTRLVWLKNIEQKTLAYYALVSLGKSMVQSTSLLEPLSVHCIDSGYYCTIFSPQY